MKHSVSVSLIAIILMAVAYMAAMPAQAGAADWRVVRQSSYGDASFYDAESVQRLEGQIVSLRARIGSAEVRYEMRCGKKEARLLADGQNGKWFPIAGGTDEELIYQAVCP
jgi:hypothetical protein